MGRRLAVHVHCETSHEAIEIMLIDRLDDPAQDVVTTSSHVILRAFMFGPATYAILIV